MKAEQILQALRGGNRLVRQAGSPTISGPSSELSEWLSGTWTSDGKGWNLIALPFRGAPNNYRLLLNQYSETLEIKDFSASNVPNRGIAPDGAVPPSTDQLIDALEYRQDITQVAAAENPDSGGLMPKTPDGIHLEPGLFLRIFNHQATHDGASLDIARLATIPHGDSVLAQGTFREHSGVPNIPDLDAFPQRIDRALAGGYLAPYQHFEEQRFLGTVPAGLPGFPGFFASNANAILQQTLPSEAIRTIELKFDTTWGKGGILNLPFVVREADAVEMQATFWLTEFQPDLAGQPTRWEMRYSQVVMLDFFPSGKPGERIRWPHVSINTLTKKLPGAA